ncbi:hypothetical protein GJV85_06625 [Sulfurimonas aquatica]|uniref:Lipoprotein n=1 Tax=Sulfurimonas aquatica TaxID=2672570 RepID=A0A975GCN3_9BACT|nr:hypothetical protein [Sulfurimonas aquatica]QSZ41795.1 hypothetical protein GJV85_06625 [Sulfurimonas aquatica]
MKTFLVILIFSIIFSACSKNNAFYRFNITKTQEISEDNILSVKIKKNGIGDGIATVIYLNKVFPQTYNDDEYFYISMYTKSNRDNFDFFINDNRAYKIERLDSKNEFSTLVSVDTQWRQNYLIRFTTQERVMNFYLKSSEHSSDKLIFEKDED